MRFTLLTSFIIIFMNFVYAKGGNVGNGGDAVFCSWRKPLTLDYYGLGFSGGVEKGRISKIQNFYKTKESLDEVVLSVLKQSIKLAHSDMNFYGTTRKHLKRLRKKVTKGLKKFFNYRDWNQIEKIPVINDSFHDYFLPKGCEIKQVAQFLNNEVNVKKSLFQKLDDVQKQFLALHESIYWVGRKYYKHSNSYLTRNLIRALMRKSKTPKDQELYLAASLFIRNKLPDTTQGLKENTPGSAPFYSWSLNLMDLQGVFINHRRNISSFCPQKIEINVQDDLSFSGFFHQSNQKDPFDSLNLFTNTTAPLISLKDQGLIKLNQEDVEYLKVSLERNRPLWISHHHFLSFLGLNQQDEIYFLSKRAKIQCLYERSLQ